MKNENEVHEKYVPPADLILSLLNEEPGTDEAFLDYYDAYIRAASYVPVYLPNGNRVGYRLNEDLMQEIRIALFKSLPALRKMLMDKHLRQQGRRPIVFIVTTSNGILE